MGSRFTKKLAEEGMASLNASYMAKKQRGLEEGEGGVIARWLTEAQIDRGIGIRYRPINGEYGNPCSNCHRPLGDHLQEMGFRYGQHAPRYSYCPGKEEANV